MEDWIRSPLGWFFVFLFVWCEHIYSEPQMGHQSRWTVIFGEVLQEFPWEFHGLLTQNGSGGDGVLKIGTPIFFLLHFLKNYANALTTSTPNRCKYIWFTVSRFACTNQLLGWTWYQCFFWVMSHGHVEKHRQVQINSIARRAWFTLGITSAIQKWDGHTATQQHFIRLQWTIAY